MISPLDPNSQILVADLDRINDRLSQANQQISSGVRVSVASDAPGSVADILDLQSGIGRSQQIQSNLARVKSETDTADSALQNAVHLLDRARSIGTMGATTNYEAQDRQAMADEVSGILESMVGLSNATANGRYIFGGDNDTAQPYKYDITLVDYTVPQIDPVDRTSAPAVSTRAIEKPDGTTFVAARSAQQIFDSGADSVFNVLAQLVYKLKTGTPDDVSAIMSSLRNAGDHLNAQLTFYGTVSNTVSDATDAASRQEAQLKTGLSAVRDTDITEAALELQQASVSQQAALGAFSKRPHTSLFDYLG